MALAINIAKIKSFIEKALKFGRQLPKPDWLLPPAPEGRLVSPILLRILAVNAMALAILVGSLLYLNRYQDRLISSELDALRLQAILSASALGEGAVVIDDEERNYLSPVLSRAMIRRLVEANETRTRLYSLDNDLIADSRLLQGHAGRIQRMVLKAPNEKTFFLRRWVSAFFDSVDKIAERNNFPLYPEETSRRKSSYEIVKTATGGDAATQVWSRPEGGLLMGVAVPVQRYKQVLGVLMLTRPDTAIDLAVREVRMDILKIFAMTLLITMLLSLYLAREIANPIRQLAKAADRLRLGQKQIVGLAGTSQLLSRDTIPDLRARRDEIGDLSAALRDLTSALAKRIGAIENFAADVSHEIKNPLTSLRSAVETAEKVQDPTMQRRLMAVIRDDVDRLDRLISDISNASRLDAELSRDQAVPVDMGQVLSMLVDFHNAQRGDDSRSACLACKELPKDLYVLGVEVRLVQVFQNLISNALSFAPPESEVTLEAKVSEGGLIVTVEDCGPGIPENKLDSIFDRFYSERPRAEKFGTHSGLGLSISKQIVEAHRGHIWAENKMGEGGHIKGARFTVALPLLKI
jgi:two-component system sensor histidine kinase ChvG